MHALIVVAHPLPDSLTQAVTAQLAQGIGAASSTDSWEIADLISEGFDPRFNREDLALFRGDSAPVADIAAEQARLERADALVLVYPLYWWSFPAVLKGWIDRVFNYGWAYEDKDGTLVKKLGWLPVHLVALGGADRVTLDRHGYEAAMKTQIDHGIFGYCGAPVKTSTLLLASDDGYPEAHLQRARFLGQRLFAEHRTQEDSPA